MMVYIMPFRKKPVDIGQGFHGPSHRDWPEDGEEKILNSLSDVNKFVEEFRQYDDKEGNTGNAGGYRRRCGAYLKQKDFFLEILDQYNVNGIYQHPFRFAKPGAIAKVRDYLKYPKDDPKYHGPFAYTR